MHPGSWADITKADTPCATPAVPDLQDDVMCRHAIGRPDQGAKDRASEAIAAETTELVLKPGGSRTGYGDRYAMRRGDCWTH